MTLPARTATLTKHREYLGRLHSIQWDCRDKTCPHDNHLFRSDKDRKNPPVFLKAHAGHNVLLPRDRARTKAVLRLIPTKRRQTRFGSMRSSQALAQSVFGNLIAHGRLDCLDYIPADDGGLAFGPGPFEPSQVKLEVSVGKKLLREPRPTNIDVEISGRQTVCVECKFTEAEVGPCSRPRLKSDNPKYCDGSYMRQKERRLRCSLSEQDIMYWKYIPSIMKGDGWNPGRNHPLCPLNRPYQLVRNILAACVENGRVTPDRGHALLVYDERNPAFGVDKDGTFERLRRDLRDPAMLRRCSWQRIVRAMRDHDDLQWLVAGLKQKYGIEAASSRGIC